MLQQQKIRCYLTQILLLLSISHFSCAEAALDQEFAQQLNLLAPYEEVAVIVTMKEMALPQIFTSPSGRIKDGNLAKALKAHAETIQKSVRSFVKSQGARNFRDMWIINGLAVTIRADQIRKLAAQPGVVSVRRDEVVSFVAPQTVTTPAIPEWNLSTIHVPEVWAAGNTGKGVVIATMDTGVDILHSDIAGKWRGGSNSWFDPNGQHSTPFDAKGHGTQVMGLLVGGNTSGVNIGVAPDAKFIAAKIFNDNGDSTYSAIHAAFQWMLDPDNNPATQDAPNVVNASWGLPGTNNKCIVEFDTDIRMLKAANIAVVFAGGNDGPAPATGVSPANSAGVIASGAVGASLDISNFSSRGPSPCTAGIYPSLVAPGEGIYTTDLPSSGVSGYTTVSGTSFAAPHVAGVLALLAGKFPDLTVADLENAVMHTTQDMGDPGADNNYGLGLLNVNAALLVLNGRPSGKSPVIKSLPPVVAMQGVAYAYQVVATDADGDTLSYSLDVFPPGMSISASGNIFWVPGSNQTGQQLVTLRVTDATGLYAIQTYVVVVANVNNAPVANDDNYQMVQATTLTVPSIVGVLANDTDRDSNRLVAVNYSSASTGILSGSEDGSFVYRPPSPSFVGIVTFTYQASDGALSSTAATATITVLPTPGSTLSTPAPQFPVGTITPEAPVILPNLNPIDSKNEPVPDPSPNPPSEGGTAEDEKIKPPATIKEADAAATEGSPVITSTPSESAKQGNDYYYQVDLSNEGDKKYVFSLDVSPVGMSINETGLIKWRPSKNQIGVQKVVVRVTDTPRLYALQPYSLVVEQVNDAPLAVADNYILPQAKLLHIAAPGVLKNDTDADKDPLHAVSYSFASTGLLEGMPDGSFSYAPPTPNFSGDVTFTYKANDGALSSDEAIVKLRIVANRAPIANDDFISARTRLPILVYQPLRINVLANDDDPDTEFDPSNKIAPETLKIMSQPNKGGTLVIDPDGMISYTPAKGFRGIDTFKYAVKDTRNAISRTASVQINVK